MSGTADPLREAARRGGGAPAVEPDEGPPVSWRELDRRVDERAEELGAEGGVPSPPGAAAAPGAESGADPLAVRLRPSLDAVVTIHAALRAGRPLLPLHAAWTEAECEQARRAVAAASLPAGTAFVLWTSGTSGRPRGVALSLEGLRAVSDGSRERLGLDPTDRWYGVLSPAHVGGLALVLRAAWTGATVVPRASFDPDEVLALAAEGRVTHASLVPVMLRRILEAADGGRAPEALRCLLVGGAGAPVELVRAATEAGWPVALTYGLTEASSQVATAPPTRVRDEPRTAGSPLSGVEVRLAGADGAAPAAKPSDPPGGATDGEILVRGPTVALGYVGTDEPFPLEGGWLRTGDLGEWIGAEGRGRARELRVVGRRSQRIVSGGVNVDPAEVEAVLTEHPGVREAAVVGLADPEWGERVAALAVPVDPGAAPDPEALARFLRGRLAGPKIPRVLRLAESLPRNANGKVDRDGVRARLDARP